MDGKPRAGRRLPRMRWDLAAVAVAFAAPIAVLVLGDGDRPAGLTIDRSSAQASAAGGGGGAPAPAADAVIVRFERDASADERRSARADAGVALERTLPVPGMQLVRPGPGTSVQQAIAELESSHAVRYAEPDVARSAFVIPDDTFFGLLWGLHNTGQTVNGAAGAVDADIDAPEAWDATTGSAGVAIAVVDSGIDRTHPDLAPNMWTNPGESGDGRETNGIDDDGNGRVDDARGWDFVDADADPADANGHGTHVAGTIGARGGDGVGVAGVTWRSALVPLRVLGPDGSGRVSDAIRAYAYAAAKQIPIVNVSLGGAQESIAERDAFRAAPNTLFVVAAGNTGADVEVTPTYPCRYEEPNVLCVAATDQNDQLATFSNFGARSVDLAAPGVSIGSTWLNGEWVFNAGTSMAAPHVSGVAALVLSANPTASVADVRAAILASVEPRPSLTGRTVTGGLLNARGAVTARAPAGGTPQPPPADTGSPPVADAAPVAPPAPPAPPPPPPPLAQPVAPPPPLAANDITAPAVRVTVEGPRRVSAALRGGLRAAVRCSEGCTARGSLLLRAAPARAAGLTRRRSGTVTVARGGASLARAGTARVRLRFTSAARRRLRGRTVDAVLRVTAVDPAGNARTVSRRVRLGR